MSMWPSPITDEDLAFMVQQTRERDWTGRDEGDALLSLVAEVRRSRAEGTEAHKRANEVWGRVHAHLNPIENLWREAHPSGAGATTYPPTDEAVAWVVAEVRRLRAACEAALTGGMMEFEVSEILAAALSVPTAEEKS